MRFLKLFSLVCVFGLLAACASKQPLNDSSTINANNSDKVAAADSTKEIAFSDVDTVYFDFDSSAISQEEKEKVFAQAGWLKSHPFNSFVIEGHTDTYGTREYNLALGERRANAIKDLLVQEGISSDKIKVVSFGKERLVSTDEQWKNRRTVSIVN